MALRSAVSSKMTSTSSVRPSGAALTRTIRPFGANKVSNAAAIDSKTLSLPSSTCRCTSAGGTLIAISRRRSPSRLEIAIVPVAASRRSFSCSGTFFVSAMIAAATEAFRCWSRSQFSRKFAMDGTKISTSEIMTNRIVRTRSFVPSPARHMRRSDPIASDLSGAVRGSVADFSASHSRFSAAMTRRTQGRWNAGAKWSTAARLPDSASVG